MENLALIDLRCSEGAIYNMGFESGVKSWRRFLKPGGVLSVSELTWTTGHRPPELQTHWEREYPDVGTAAVKLGVLERHGYSPGATSCCRLAAGWTTTTDRCRPVSAIS